MRGRLFLIVLCLSISLLPACAKSVGAGRHGKEEVRIKGDAVAASYADFIRAELERDKKESPSLSIIDRLIENGPPVGAFYYQKALINADAGNWNEVAANCQRALELSPDDDDAKFLLARALGVLKEHEKAISILEDLKRKGVVREDVYILLAKEYMNVGRYGDAEAAITDLLKESPESTVGYYYLGAIYGGYMKEPRKAIEVYNRILEADPENYQVMEILSQLYSELGEFGDAIKMLSTIEGANPLDPSIKIKLSQMYYKKGDYPSAIKKIEEALLLEPKSDKIAYYLGILYGEVGRNEDSARTLKKIMPSSPLYRDARLKLAYDLNVSGKIEEAKEVLSEGIKRSPKIIEFYQYLAGLLEFEGNYLGAAKLLMKAHKVFQNDPRFPYAIAVLYDRLHNPKSAMEWMRKTLAIDPKNALAMNYIGYTLVEMERDLDEAERLLEEAATLRPDDGYIIDSLGWLYYKKGDLTKAIGLLKKAYALVPNEPTILRHLGEVYTKRGNKKEAVFYLKKALSELKNAKDATQKEVDEIVELIQNISK